ncbi:7-deoxyloganetin glucosyltransferase [Linum perenne]
MLKLAKLLHQRGFHVTFVNTEYNHRRLLKSRGSSVFESLSSRRFRFETIPDGLPLCDEDDVTQDVPSLCESMRRTCLGPFKRLVSKLNDTALGDDANDDLVPPVVTCMVSDCLMGFTFKVSKEIGIPNVMFWTASACSFMDPNDLMFNFIIKEGENAQHASAFIINTFDKLEDEIIRSLSLIFDPLPMYTIGPLNLVNLQESDLNDSIGLNLWKEEPGCIEWLDQKEPESVVYVNFGSITVMTPHQLVEFAWGLANSGKTFLWVIRSDLVRGESAVLAGEFMDEIKERGMLVSWCPQDEVIRHPSIGGFLTHCGWNSTLESLTSGVPMICWPFFADQQTNCWFVCYKWGVGLEIESDVKRDEIDKLVRELIDGEKGKEMKERALEWKKLAKDATENEIGDAYLNLENVVRVLLASK